MNTLIALTLIWAGLLVLALILYLTATALYLHRARRHLVGIAQDLEQIAEAVAPLDKILATIGAEVQDILTALA